MFPKLDYIKQLVEGLKFAANRRFVNLEKFAEDAKAKLTTLLANRPNWNQNDPTALDYVQGRTHWVEKTRTVIANEDSMFFEWPAWEFPLVPIAGSLVLGEKYKVKMVYPSEYTEPFVDGEFVCENRDYGLAIIVPYESINFNYAPKPGTSVGEWGFYVKNGELCIYEVGYYGADYRYEIDFYVEGVVEEYRPLDPRFVPAISGVIPVEHGGTGATTKDGAMAAFGQGYVSCSTAAATAAKTASINGFVLGRGALVGIKFSFANTASAPTLNVDSTGAKSIYNYKTNAAVASGDMGDCLHLFMYNGFQWVLLNPLT